MAMGMAKRDGEDIHYRGYGHSEKFICANHFGDEALRQAIRNSLEDAACSFCPGPGGAAPKAANTVAPMAIDEPE